VKGTAAPSCVVRQYQRVKVCERMGWTFDQHDQARAGDVLFTLKVWEIEAEASSRGR
jgi:hypothetical protein